MGYLNQTTSLFKYLDIFGINVQLNFKQKIKYRSNFGAFISIIVLVASFYFLIKQLLDWFQVNVSTTVNSSENFPVSRLLNENLSIEYTLDQTNYALYFAIAADFPNGTSLTYKELDRYFTIEYLYSETGHASTKKSMESIDCNVRAQNEFLNLYYDKREIPENMTNPWRICVKNPLRMGLFPEQEVMEIYTPTLYLQIRQCINSTKNNNFCASVGDIKEMMKYVTVQATIPKTIYDFKNQSQPIKRTYTYEYYKLDFGLQKYILNQVNPTYLFKDFGLFNDNYRLDSINFNSGQQTIDFRISNEEEESILLEYGVLISNQRDNYYIRNQKFNDIIGSFGGIINVFYTIGSIFCVYINRILFTNSLLNLAFKVNICPTPKSCKISSRSEFNKKKNKKNEKIFTLCSCIGSFFNFKSKDDDSYKKSKKFLNEYIDLKKIIRRLQDVDKLKNIILNDSQRFFFDLIPKPEFSITNNKVDKLSIRDKNILRENSKTVTNEKILENYAKLCEELSQTDEKILSMLDKKTSKIINLTHIKLKKEDSKKLVSINFKTIKHYRKK